MGLQAGDALIIVDVQNDFLPGGSLPVPEADKVILPLNRYSREFAERGLPVYATRDWHPADHCSFLSQGGKWPPHCVADTWGAEFPQTLELPRETVETVSKGAYRDAEAYSAFEGTNFSNRLRMRGCRRLFIGGLALDYCVRATAIDALRLGFKVVLLQDAVRAIEARPGDGARATGDVLELGGALASFAEVVHSERAAARASG